MDDIRLEYSSLRDSFNVFVNGEWYSEGTYEQCCEVMDSFFFAEEEYYGDNGDDGYRPEEEYEYD